MNQSPRLSLPYLQDNQLKKHVSLNDALAMLDGLCQMVIDGGPVVSLPDTPTEGQCVLISDAPSAELAAHAGHLAIRDAGGWVFRQPATGWRAWHRGQGELQVFDGNAFVSIRPETLDTLGIGTPPSSGNTLTVSGSDTLFTHAGSDHRLTINKSDMGSSAALQFKIGFDAAAEIGLVGDDRLKVRTRAPGGAFSDAISIDRDTGHVGIAAAPTERLRVADGFARLGLHMINCNEVPGTAAMEIGHFATGDRHTYFDFRSSDHWSDFDARVIRRAGKDGAFVLETRGKGGIELAVQHSGPVTITTSNTERMRVTDEGKVGIGTSNPTVALQVEGLGRLSVLTPGSLPAPGAAGPGAFAIVQSPSFGTTLAICDGAAWHRFDSLVAVQ